MLVMKRQPQQCQNRIVDFAFVDLHLAILPRANAKIPRPPRMRTAVSIFDKTQSDALAVLNNFIERRVIRQLSESHTLRRYSKELDRRRREAVGETV